MDLHSTERGFSLIELLIVIAIIGILAAIALPQLSAYRQRAWNTSAHADIKNFRITIEASHSDNNLYPSSISNGETLTGGATSTTTGLTYSPSFNVFLWYESITTAYLANSWHKSGTKQFGVDEKTKNFYVAPGIAPQHTTLANHISNSQIWPAPWEVL